ncbi:MAG: sensor signal transduction histidine kinase [Ferruginibacter sp.]|nr:sensor signal transduction histidine kinase [Ferruginibacter sp.]
MSLMAIDQNFRFLTGGGEMGVLTREKDWSQNPVGPVEDWPQSLRTTLSIILNSRFPMFLWWGPELICFYNDAYRPSLGQNGKHPAILGQRAEDAWPEIWHIIKPLIDQVLEGGEATWSEDQLIPIYRNGKLEDVYWTFSYSPVCDESGQVAGVLVTCSETTEKVNSLKILEKSNRRYFDQIMQAPIAICIFRGKEHIVEIANQQMLLFWDKTAAQVINKPIFESLPEARGQGLEQLLDRVFITGQKYVANERPVDLFRNGSLETVYVNFIYEALKEPDDTINGVVAICSDVTLQVMARKKIEESEKKFRNTVIQAPLGITILQGPLFIVEMANNTYLQLVDKKETDFVGRPLFESLPEVKQSIEPILRDVLQTGVAFNAAEFPVTLTRVGIQQLTYFNMVYHPLREDNGKIAGIIVVATEVTELVRAKHSLAESENQFRHLVTQSPVAMTVVRGKDFIIEMANKVMFRNVWRKKESEVLGKSILEVFPELQEQKYPELLNEVYTTGKIHREMESVAYVEGNDGRRKFYLDYQYAPLLEPDGSISGIMITVNDVTEKVVAREKVEESEKRFRTIADSAPVLIWMSGIDKGCSFFNKAWLMFTGRTMEEESGNGWAQGVHPDDLDRCMDIYVQSSDRREEFYMEYRLMRHDGEYRWISNKGIPRFTLDGIFEGYIGACMDIHERTIIQQKLKKNEEKLNLVIDASDLGTWELNVKTFKVKCSDRYLQIFGYSKQTDITHQQLLSHIHPDDLATREQALQRAFVTGVLHYKVRLIWNDGSIHWVEKKGKILYDESNQPVLLIGTLLDITEEQYYQQKLQDREQKFRLLADSMPQHIWTADPEGNLNYFNQSVFSYSGLSPEQLERDGWIQIVHPDDREENIRAWLKAINSGEDFLLEHRFRRFDGEYRWQLSRAIPQKNAEGNIQMWVGTSTDVQDQKTFTNELERQVRERTAELEQKNRELQTMNTELQSFAYVSSHDLQEPLRKIQTFSTIIVDKEEQNLSEKGRDYFHRMQEAAKRMQTLIEDLLAYSRTNTTERVFEHVDLTKIIEEVKTELKEDIQGKNAVIESGQLCAANIIPFQFKQLVHNLIGNALKFSKPGEPPHIILASKIMEGSRLQIPELSPDQYYCHLSITDNGIGFDPQYKDRIFQVFQRLHGKDEYKGTGIGLAIVKKIVENHHGLIRASGELHKGARFDIYLPEPSDKKYKS